ncbi:hypothetical protein F5X96DRAFT_613116 [Biscogniauxia mediterranea]|nr:hypothetical protein F5X96DRAFT_613116 [Biscogniauxia mediterranea]
MTKSPCLNRHLWTYQLLFCSIVWSASNLYIHPETYKELFTLQSTSCCIRTLFSFRLLYLLAYPYPKGFFSGLLDNKANSSSEQA